LYAIGRSHVARPQRLLTRTRAPSSHAARRRATRASWTPSGGERGRTAQPSPASLFRPTWGASGCRRPLAAAPLSGRPSGRPRLTAALWGCASPHPPNHSARVHAQTHTHCTHTQHAQRYAPRLPASFLEAASRYYELSSLGGRTIGGSAVSDEDVQQALRSATVCTVLAAVRGGLGGRGLGPGPRRAAVCTVLAAVRVARARAGAWGLNRGRRRRLPPHRPPPKPRNACTHTHTHTHTL
jgi:hypothetical protein